MTNHRALTFSFLTAVAVLIAAPAAAQTDCQPGDLFCAELRIGPGQGTLRIGPGPVVQPAPPPPPVVIAPPAPQPPTVYLQPPAPQPPPPQVYVRPAPPPPPVQQYVVQQPPPQQVYVQQPVMVEQRPQRERFEIPESSTGINITASGLLGQDLAMVGGSAAFRLRPIRHIAVDIGAGVYGGNDYNGLDRITVPVTVDALIYFNPQSRFAFYGIVGIGGSYGHAEGFNIHTGVNENRDYFHLGGAAGIGAEWRIGRNFALNLDVRGFIQERVDENPQPEFRELDNDGTWLETDTSGGFAARGGMTFYFD